MEEKALFAFEKEKEERKEPKFGIDGKKAKEVVEGGTGKDEFIGGMVIEFEDILFSPNSSRASFSLISPRASFSIGENTGASFSRVIISPRQSFSFIPTQFLPQSSKVGGTLNFSLVWDSEKLTQPKDFNPLNLTIESVTEQSAMIVGYTPDSLKGKKASVLIANQNPCHTFLFEEWGRKLFERSSGKSEPTHIITHDLLTHKNGALLEITTQAAVFNNPQTGRPCALMCFLKDMKVLEGQEEQNALQKPQFPKIEFVE